MSNQPLGQPPAGSCLTCITVRLNTPECPRSHFISSGLVTPVTHSHTWSHILMHGHTFSHPVTQSHTWSHFLMLGHAFSHIVTHSHTWSHILTPSHTRSPIVTLGHISSHLDTPSAQVHKLRDKPITIKAAPPHRCFLPHIAGCNQNFKLFFGAVSVVVTCCVV